MSLTSGYFVGTGIKGKTLDFLSNFLSILLIPLLIPVYLCGIVLYYFPSELHALTPGDKWMVAADIFIFTIVLPFILVYVLYKMKVISSLSLYKREDRFIPQAFSCFSYLLVSGYFIYKFGATNILSLAMLANSISAITITLITRFWKISTHAAGAIGFLAIIAMIYMKHPSRDFSIPFLFILLSTIGVCFARLYLKAHTVMQVVGGSALGIVIGVSVFYFLN